MDRDEFTQVMYECHGNQVLMAAYYGVTPRMIRYHLVRFGLYPEYYRVKVWRNPISRGVPVVDIVSLMSRNAYDEAREVCRLAVMAASGSMPGTARILGIHAGTARRYVLALGLRNDLEIERRKAMARRNVVDVERGHRTTCWMSSLMRGTDAQRRKLVARIKEVFRSVGGNVHQAAAKLGINISTLRRYVGRLELQDFVDECRGDGGVARAAGIEHGSRGGRPRPNPG